jgi:hypothetical protein
MRPQAQFGGFDALLIGFVKSETAAGPALNILCCRGQALRAIAVGPKMLFPARFGVARKLNRVRELSLCRC